MNDIPIMRIVAPAAALAAAAVLVAAARPTEAQQEAPAAPRTAQEDHGHDDHEHGELHESMEAMQRNLKALRKLMSDPESKAAALDAVREMEASVLVGLAHVPDPLKPLEGSDLLKHDVEFKRRMADVYTTLLDMELALDAGDADELKALYRKLGEGKKEGHQIYIDGK